MSGSHSPFTISDLRFTRCIGLLSIAPSSPVLTAQKLKRLVDVMDMRWVFRAQECSLALANEIQRHDRHIQAVEFELVRLSQCRREVLQSGYFKNEIHQSSIREFHDGV